MDMNQDISKDSNTDASAGSPFAPRHSNDEIDLVDIIVFIWRLRYIISVCIFLGIFGGWLSVRFSNMHVGSASPHQVGYYGYQIPLQENLEGNWAALDRPTRIGLMNKLLQRAETAKPFFDAIYQASPEMATMWKDPLEAYTGFIIAQQDEKLQQAVITEVSKGGDLALNLKLPAKFDTTTIYQAATDGLNLLIGDFNKQRLEKYARNIGVVASNEQKLLAIRAAASGDLFRLVKEYKGPQGDLELFLEKLDIKQEESVHFKQTVDNIVRMIGMLEATKAIDAKRSEVERSRVLALIHDYKATIIMQTNQGITGDRELLTPLRTDALSIQAGLKSGEKIDYAFAGAAPTSVRLILGMFIGGFMGLLLGGIRVFIKSNWKRIKDAAASSQT